MGRDLETLRKGIAYALEHNSFNKLNLIEQAEHVCVFGLGRYFEEAFVSKGIQQAYKVDLLCDNNPEKWGRIIEGLPCISPEELKCHENVIVIIMLGNPIPVQEQLDEMGIPWVTHIDLSLDEMVGIPKEKAWLERQTAKMEQALELFEDEESRKIYVNGICNRIAYPIAEYSWKEMYSKGEYFKQPFMMLNDKEVFVDCGAYNGDTILEFVNSVKIYDTIYGFELDSNNYEEMKKRTQNLDDVYLFNSGVWNENKIITYGCGSGTNEPKAGISILKATSGDEKSATVVKLDDVLEGKKVTFIKMDIEGAEIPALEGAEEILRNQAPKLAICVYHKTSDFWEIPLLIKKCNPNYQLRLRHHHLFNCWGTVLYASLQK